MWLLLSAISNLAFFSFMLLCYAAGAETTAAMERLLANLPLLGGLPPWAFLLLFGAGGLASFGQWRQKKQARRRGL